MIEHTFGFDYGTGEPIYTRIVMDWSNWKRTLRNFLLSAAVVLYAAIGFVAWLTQPDPSPAELDALVAIAGLLATVLSLGLTVTLLVAQHTADRHARALYAEFRRERTWTWSLASLGIGVVGIVAGALLRPTVSTAWAALAMAVSLGLLAATFFPRLLDSLDRTELARRLTARIVGRLRRISRRANPMTRQKVLEPEAKRGLDIAASLLAEGMSHNDAEVVREGVAAIGHVLLAYLREIPLSIGMDDGVVFHAFQHLDVAVEECVGRSPIILLPVVLEGVTQLGAEAAQVPNSLSDYEPVSGRLNTMLFEVVTKTLTADKSAAAAMATGAIGTSAVAMVEAGRSTGVSDHIRRLGQISLYGLSTQRDHVTGVAMGQLARIAVELTKSKPSEIMPPDHYRSACEAMMNSIDAFIARTSPDGALMRDQALISILGPLIHPSVVHIALTGLNAESQGKSVSSRDFGWGATWLVHAVCRLAAYDISVVMTPVYALDCAYSSVVGAFAAKPNDRIAEHAAEWWRALWAFASSSEEAKRDHDRREIASSLLIIAIDAMRSDREPLAMMMGTAVRDALKESRAVADLKTRDRLVRSWIPAAMAALGSGDEQLGGEIVRTLRADMRRLQSKYEGRLPNIGRSFSLHAPMFGTPMQRPTNAHQRPEAAETFERLLNPPRRPRPPSPRP